MKMLKSKYWRTELILILLSLLCAVTTYFPAACDWYTDHIHRWIGGAISWIFGLIPFPAAEVGMCLTALAAVCSVLFLLLLLFLRRKPKYRKFCAGWFKTLLMAATFLLLPVVLCWMIPDSGNVLGKEQDGLRTDYSIKELSALYSHCVNELNAAAEEIEIAEDGTVRYYTDEEMRPLIEDALLALSEEYPRLKGYYPPVKMTLFSELYNNMNIAGMTYSITLEPTHSKYLPPHFTPVCSAHELCHVKGFGKENEANFISSLALSQSSDPLLRFSAYDDMISYIQTQWEDAAESIINEMRQRGDTRVPELPQIHSDMTAEEKAAFRAAMEEYNKFKSEHIGQIPSYSERANKIINNAYEIHNEVYNADSHPISESETMQETVQSVSESYWDIYEDHMQENSYDGVVLLLLQYYDGKLY